MELHTVALLSPGDMGHSVGAVLAGHGLRVITCLEGRSDRTRALAAEAGLEDVDSYAELVRQAQLLLSIVVPAQAVALAERVADALRAADVGAALTYADCNAIAPQTARQIGRVITAAGARFVDAGIIGSPPGRGGRNRIYVSGEHTEALLALNDYGLEVVDLQGEAGQASGLKMCYAALTKGSPRCARNCWSPRKNWDQRAVGPRVRGESGSDAVRGWNGACRVCCPRRTAGSARWKRSPGPLATWASRPICCTVLPRCTAWSCAPSWARARQRTTRPLPALEETIATLARATKQL